MLQKILDEYLQIFPDDKSELSLLIEQIEKGEPLNTRGNFKGHIAGDAIIFSPDLKKILLIYHKHSNRWQQPGGHWDPDEIGPWLTAKREAFEETGVRIKKQVNLLDQDERVPLQIFTGPVLASPKGEPKHWHHDFRYGFIAASEKLGKIDDDGVQDVKWFVIDQKFHTDLAEAVLRLQNLLRQ